MRQLDTYALPELMTAIQTSPDESLEPLTRAAEHMTDQPWVFRRGEQDPRDVRAHWRLWWIDNRQRFETYRGIRQLAAMLEQTRYARWALRLAAESSRVEGERLWQRLGRPASLSLYLFTATWLGYAACFGLLRRYLVGRLGQILALSVFVVPPASAALLLQRFSVSLVAVGLLSSVSGAALAAQRAALGARLGPGTTRLSEPLLFTWLGSAVVAVEVVFNLPGLGLLTFDALRQKDVDWLMGLALTAVLCAAGIRAATIAVRNLRHGEAT